MEKPMQSGNGTAEFYRWVMEVSQELERAQNKFPWFPNDPIHAAAIVAQESGELVQAALQFNYEEKSNLHMRKEAIHTAAMAMRFLMNFDSYRIHKSKEHKSREARQGFGQEIVDGPEVRAH